MKKEAIYSNYGGSNEDTGFVKSCTNAYMLGTGLTHYIYKRMNLCQKPMKCILGNQK